MGRGTGAKALFCFAEALASMLAGEKEKMPGTPLALEEGRVGEVHGPSEAERKETLSEIGAYPKENSVPVKGVHVFTF